MKATLPAEHNLSVNIPGKKDE